jgi:hypothetical protein
MSSSRLDVDNHVGLKIVNVVIQLDTSVSFENVVNLGGFLVIVLHGVRDMGDVQVADPLGLDSCQWASAGPTGTRDCRSFFEVADQITFLDGSGQEALSSE